MALTVVDQRREDIDALACIVVQDDVGDLFVGVMHHLLACVVRVGYAGAGKQKSQIIIHFRDSSHRRARVVRSGLLVDTDHGRQTCYLVHLGPTHVVQVAASVGREGVDVASLALGKDGVESQTGLAASAQACEHSQFAARDLHVHVFEVMYPRTCYLYPTFFFHDSAENISSMVLLPRVSFLMVISCSLLLARRRLLPELVSFSLIFCSCSMDLSMAAMASSY